MTKQLERGTGFCPGKVQRCLKGIRSEQIEHVYKKKWECFQNIMLSLEHQAKEVKSIMEKVVRKYN